MMYNIPKPCLVPIASRIVNYYDANPRCGHTYNQLNGLQGNAIMVVPRREYGTNVLNHDNCVSVHDPGFLFGRCGHALVIDHNVIQELLRGLLNHIDSLESQLQLRKEP